MREGLEIPVEGARVDAVGASLDLPDDDERRCAVLLAHGAGAGRDSAFMTAIAEGLAARGLAVLRFDYPYTERMRREGRRLPPDRRPLLEATHRAALATLRARFPERRLLLAGKSMGGRMGSYLAAEGADAAGLVLLGYPLHPPGKPERLRAEHFAAIALPALFLQGTRDALCRLELLRTELEVFGGVASLHVVEGADHDFRVPRSSGRSRDEVLGELADAVDAWERATFPA